MPHFHVNTTSRTKGTPKRLTVEAADQQSAAGQAVAQGYQVLSVTPVPSIDDALAESPPATITHDTDADAIRHDELAREVRKLQGAVISLNSTVSTIANSQLVAQPKWTLFQTGLWFLIFGPPIAVLMVIGMITVFGALGIAIGGALRH